MSNLKNSQLGEEEAKVSLMDPNEIERVVNFNESMFGDFNFDQLDRIEVDKQYINPNLNTEDREAVRKINDSLKKDLVGKVQG